MRDLVGLPGQVLAIEYAAGYKKRNHYGTHGVFLISTPSSDRFILTNRGFLVFSPVPQPVGNNTELTIICIRNTADGALTRISFTLTIVGKHY